jgi:hypothetical protein
LGVPGNESILVVPLRSNASTLLSGAPVAATRRRLKFASLFYDEVLLEAGVLNMQAGPHGAFNIVEPATEQPPARWQTPRERHLAEQHSFALAIGQETVPGVPAEAMRSFMQSETTICWVATLEPFADELPPDAGWVDFITTKDPTGDAGAARGRFHDTNSDKRSPFPSLRPLLLGNRATLAVEHPCETAR